MAFETLRYEVGPNGVATVTLDQPETRNALSDQVLDELIAAFEAARDDEAVRCVVLTSSHEKVFSSGANLGGFAEEQPLVHKHLGTARFPREAVFGALGVLYYSSDASTSAPRRGPRHEASRKAGCGKSARPV